MKARLEGTGVMVGDFLTSVEKKQKSILFSD